MGKKLWEKAGMVGLPKAAPAQATPTEVAETSLPPASPSRPKTAPGTMLEFMSKQSTAIQESDELKAKIAEFDGAKVTRSLDPKSIQLSAWANRHQDSFKDAEFLQLKDEIASAGGNIQPIKVRPVSRAGQGVEPFHPPGGTPEVYELIFGSRRHRACLELGLPVLAMIEEVSEQQLFVEMERENRARKDLSAWEQGRMYAKALDQGLYPSNRQLATAIGLDLSAIGKALSLARLPDAVVEAFATPLDLQYRWAKPLGDAQQKDPDGLLSRAKNLKQRKEKPSAKEIFEFLVQGEGVEPFHPPKPIDVKVGRSVAASVRVDAKGKTFVQFEATLDQERRNRLAQLLQEFLEQ